MVKDGKLNAKRLPLNRKRVHHHHEIDNPSETDERRDVRTIGQQMGGGSENKILPLFDEPAPHLGRLRGFFLFQSTQPIWRRRVPEAG